MLISQLIISNYPILNLSDKVSFALQLMEDYEAQHLPVVYEEKFVGLITKDDLLDLDETTTLSALEDQQLIKASVLQQEHLFTALKVMADQGLSVLPVITPEKELAGVITQKELMRCINLFLGPQEPGGIITLQMARRNFSFGEISRLVETNDAVITQLNTMTEAETGLVNVTVKINKVEISDVIATFQRYDYNIINYFGEEAYENELKENYDLLMAYLKI